MRTHNSSSVVSTPFDAAAGTHDRDFTLTPIARLLRAAVWARLDVHFSPGTRVLELGCGTGEDAVRLAQRGVRVMATDACSAMLAVTRSKAERAGVATLVDTLRLDLNALAATSPAAPYDGVFSNFGPLDCVADLGLLVAYLAALTNSGARLVLVVMGPFCPWEIAWQLAHAHPRTAFRRWSHNGVLAQVGAEKVHVWYPSPGRLTQLFAPAFQICVFARSMCCCRLPMCSVRSSAGRRSLAVPNHREFPMLVGLRAKDFYPCSTASSGRSPTAGRSTSAAIITSWN